MPYRPRDCQVCGNQFTPPHRATFLSTGDNHLRLCPSCRRAAKAAHEAEAPAADTPQPHRIEAPMRQVVFDLETWGLDRGWGVTMVASFLIHGGPEGTVQRTLTLRQYPAWQAGKRSDDRALVEEIFALLAPCHIAYAHNGDRFDVRWLRTVALKYGLQMPKLKLVDPCALAWKKYLLGRNSLEAVADFLGLSDKKDANGRPLEKLHISPDVWRHALMDDDDAAWGALSERCESDVELLNVVAARVTGDVGLVDYSGSWR